MESSEDAIISSSSGNDDKLELSVEQPKWNTHCMSSIVRQRNIFILTTIIFLVAFFVLLICFITKAAQPNENVDSAGVCTSAACVKVSSEVISNMDVSLDPCDDFYNYACGGWKKENDIPDTESRWGQLIALAVKNVNYLNKRINDQKVRAMYKDNEAVMKAFKFYDSCMNNNRINALGVQPLLDLIEKLGSWNLSHSGLWKASSRDFIKTLVQTHHYSSPFFSIKVVADYLNSTINIITLDQSGLFLTKEAYLQNNTDYKKIRDAYKKFMIQIVGLLGAKGDDAKRQMMDVYDFEEKLANITDPPSVKRRIAENYNKRTIKQLVDYTGNAINFKYVLQTTFKNHSTITNDTIVAIRGNVDFFRDICQLYEKTPTTTVANYMMWHVVLNFIKFLPGDFKKIIQELNEVRSGVQKEMQQWRECLKFTSNIFGMPLGVVYITEKYTRETKLKVQELIHGIREVFIKNLEQVDWMDKETKNVAKEKAHAMMENIGYPDYITNKTALADEFRTYETTGDFFDNIVRAKIFDRKKNLERISQPPNKKEWILSPQTVNAYYSVSDNKIVFPAGILQAPFFSKDGPRALNYGSVGVIVGHEITHGFDDNGRRFTKDGNLRKWWSNHSIDAFKNKADCLVKQYSQYEYEGQALNGDQTLGENIADNGALKQAYQAYQNAVKQTGQDQLLPGLNASNDQLFFLGFAQVWCGKYRRQTALKKIATGYHAMGMYRVIGSISNSEGFAKAYQCAPGTKMNPKKKCQVW